MATIKVRGVDRLMTRIRFAKAQMWPTTMAIIEKYVDMMIAEARENAPVDLGVARDSLGKEVRDRSVVYFLASAHGAIQEFGYGGRMADIPTEMEEEARKFKGYKSGDFKEFVAELKEWCVRKGIDPEAAYPIAASILDKGLQPRPFYYPAYQKYKPDMLKEIEENLKNLFNF